MKTKPTKLSTADALDPGTCGPNRRCKLMLYALEHVARAAIEDLTSVPMKDGKPSGPPKGHRVALRLRGNRLGAFIFCPWCGAKLLPPKDLTPQAKSRLSGIKADRRVQRDGDESLRAPHKGRA